MNWKVPLADVDFDDQEQIAVQKVIQSGWLSMGPITKQFEQEFAKFVSADYALAVTNATAALHLACLAAGIGSGDEVIVPSLTFVASANAIRYTGATPVFADIESLDCLTISPASIRSRITEHTRAIQVMHYAGFPCDMTEIQKIVDEYDLILLEDSAHAIGSNLNDRSLGTFGSIGCFSFFANKNMTTAEGGMLVTDDKSLADKVSVLRSHGMTSLSWDRHQGHAFSYDVIDLGYNYRIDEIRSALGLVQLEKVSSGNFHRRELTTLYRELLNKDTPSILVPFLQERGISSCHIFPILLPVGCDRRQFMDSLRKQEIQTSNHYPPAHLFSIYQEKWQSDEHPLPLTEEVASRQVTLPLFSTMKKEQVSLVVKAAKRALQEQGVI